MTTARQLIRKGHATLVAEYGEPLTLAGGKVVTAIITQEKQDLGNELGVVTRMVASVAAADVAGLVREYDVLTLESGASVKVAGIEPHALRDRLKIIFQREVV